MQRKIMVVTAAYGHDAVRSAGGQAAMLPIIAAAGADGVEIRREMFTPQSFRRCPRWHRRFNHPACRPVTRARSAVYGRWFP